MKYNEAQQKERMANGLSSIAFGIDVLILIALAKFVPIVGGILALGWFVLICVGAKAHYDHVKSLADAPSEAARVFDSSRDTDFETLGKDEDATLNVDGDGMGREIANDRSGMRANMDTMTPTP